jgi:hypothetical protein
MADELLDGVTVVDDAGVSQLCSQCGCCGQCACDSDHDELCGWCAKYRSWAEQARPAVVAYPTGAGGAGRADHPERRRLWLVHALNCPSQISRLEGVERVLDGGCPHRRWGHDLRLPAPAQEPAQEKELVRGRRCLVCSPDVIPPRPRDMRFGSSDRIAEQDKQ